ncbi:hypothetical protein MNBD_DELTA04-830 [hydrothermal vent metagenome]|uniref:Uncharacterized protein n=1 Tax=hydrothermal vent metagenome TaxID=652676 RepID=A0A3B0VW70_9ZZZZ
MAQQKKFLIFISNTPRSDFFCKISKNAKKKLHQPNKYNIMNKK